MKIKVNKSKNNIYLGLVLIITIACYSVLMSTVELNNLLLYLVGTGVFAINIVWAIVNAAVFVDKSFYIISGLGFVLCIVSFRYSPMITPIAIYVWTIVSSKVKLEEK